MLVHNLNLYKICELLKHSDLMISDESTLFSITQYTMMEGLLINQLKIGMEKVIGM